MTDPTENRVLEMLKNLRNDVVTLRTEMHDQFAGLKRRSSRSSAGSAA